MYVPVPYAKADGEAQRELQELGIEEARMKSELKAYIATTADGTGLADYYLKSEADKVIAELKAREDVLVTDNRNLLDKVKKLEERLHENAEHFKRNEAQILENSDKAIAEKDKEIARLDDLAHAHNIELLRKENLIAELKNLKQALMADDLRYRYRIRHQKHKRCLAMALLWLERAENSTDLENEFVSRRRCSKWMELAEVFK